MGRKQVFMVKNISYQKNDVQTDMKLDMNLKSYYIY